MKKALLTLALLTVAAVVTRADTLADWTFEGTPVSTALTSATDFDYGPADSGVQTVSSDASGHHVSTATAWSFPTGNGSAKSFSSTRWTVGDYWQFTLNTSTYTNLVLNWDQAGSSTGPANFRLAYSSDGGMSFTDFGTYSVVLQNFSAGTAQTSPSPHQTFDLSAITALNNNASVIFRLVDNSTASIGGGTVGTAGTDRVDNFTVSGTTSAVPEPSVLGMIGLGAAGLVGALRYRRRK
jgi:hypothetical protein